MTRHRLHADWRVLLVLVAFLAGAVYLVVETTEEWRSAPRPGRRAAVPFRGDAGGDTWAHHAWTPDAAADPDSDRPPPPTPLYDPQRWAMVRELGVYGDAGAELPFAVVEREGAVVAVDGRDDVERGARCTVRVLPAQRGGYDCLVRVMCGGRILYPGPAQTGGYNHCAFEDGAPARVVDRETTDGDPSLRLDLERGEVTASDGAWTVRARLR